MVGKFNETCPMCKQFKMLCMCGISLSSDRKGRMGRRTSTEKALAFAQSLAIWRRRTRRPRTGVGTGAPSRESSIRTLATNSPTIPQGLSISTITGVQTQEVPVQFLQAEDEANIDKVMVEDEVNITHQEEPEPKIESTAPRPKEFHDVGHSFGYSNLQPRNIVHSKSTAKMLLLQEINYEEELVAAVPSRRNWTGIAIALLVIISVIGLIGLAVLIMTPADDGRRVPGRKLTIEDLISKEFKPRQFNGTWVSGKELLFQDASGGLSILNFAENKTSIFMSNSTFRQLNSDQFSVSGDLQYVSISNEPQKYFQNKVTSKYKLFSIQTRSQVDFTIGSGLPDRFQWFWWSPVGHSVLAVLDNDLYYVQDPTKISVTSHRLTTTGVYNTIYNGLADRLYEEEILGEAKASWFSPDAKKLLFATFNDSKVGLISFNEFSAEPSNIANPLGTPPPQEMAVRYSKTGSAIPEVSFTVVNLESMIQTSVQPPVEIQNRDHYFTSVRWVNSNDLSIVWTNRLLNLSIVSLCKHPKYICKEVYREEITDGRGWIEIRKFGQIFSSNADSIVTIRPVRDSTAGHYAQVVKVDISSGLSSQIASSNADSLTHGQFEVTQLVDWDEKNQLVYYISTLKNQPGVRHLFRVTDHITDVLPECLTCDPETQDDLMQEPDSDSTSNDTFKSDYCQYIDVHISPDRSYYVFECLGPHHPTTSVFSLPDNQFVTWLDKNEDLKDNLEKVAIPQMRRLQIPLPGTQTKANVLLLLPPGFREYEEFKFPLIFHLNEGPGSQQADFKWRMNWDTYLSGAKDFVVALADVRGSGANGDAFKHAVFRQLGVVETKDSIHVLKYLIDNVNFIDGARVAVWGHGFGGHLAVRLLGEDIERHVNCAIAVSPVSKWQSYESYRTEKFMGMPGHDGNWRGYEESDLTSKVIELFDREFFLIHGTGNDIVHFEQSMTLVKSLVESNILFRQQIYPSVSGEVSWSDFHLYRSLEQFLHQSFKSFPDWFSEQCVHDDVCFV